MLFKSQTFSFIRTFLWYCNEQRINEFSVSKHRPHAHNVNNLHNHFDCYGYKADHDLPITYEKKT